MILNGSRIVLFCALLLTILTSNQTLAQNQLPILKIDSAVQALLRQTKITEGSLYSKDDAEKLHRLQKFFSENPKPTTLRAQGEWLIKIAGAIPTVLLSLGFPEVPMESWVFEEHNPSLRGTQYSLGEAALPVLFLRLIYASIFTKNPLDVDFKPIQARDQSIPFSPLTFALIKAVSLVPIHVQTAELKAHILISLFEAPPSAFMHWTDDEIEKGSFENSLEDIQLNIANVLASEYWITSNSPRMQSELMSRYVWSSNLKIRTLSLKAAKNSAMVLVVGQTQLMAKLLTALLKEIPPHLNASTNQRAHIEFLEAVFELFREVQKFKWANKELHFDRAISKIFIEIRKKKGQFPCTAESLELRERLIRAIPSCQDLFGN